MKNKKFINILKISILTLLIILGTVGSTYAYQSAEHFMFPPDSSGNLVERTSVEGPELNPDSIGFSDLENNNGILCDQLGHELKDSKRNDPDPNGFTMPDDGIYPENVTSRYIYDSVTTCQPTEEEMYIFLQIPSQWMSHWARPSQWAWWAHGSHQGSGASASISRVLGALDFEKANSPFSELYNFNNLLGDNSSTLSYDSSIIEQLVFICGDEYEKIGLTEDDENAINDLNYASISEFWLDLAAKNAAKNNNSTVSNKLDNLNVEQSKLKAIEEKIRDFTFTSGALVDANGQPVYDSPIDIEPDVVAQVLDEAVKNVVDANSYTSFTQTYLNSDDTVKDDYQTKINYDGSEVLYNEEHGVWLVGPMSIHYLDEVSPSGVRFAGITEHHLNAKYRDDHIGTLTYNEAAGIDGLSASEYTFLTTDLGKFSENYYNYPSSDDKFYIAIGYDEDLEKVIEFEVTDEYTIMTAEPYTVYADGHYVNYKYETEISVDSLSSNVYFKSTTTTYCDTCKKNIWNSTTGEVFKNYESGALSDTVSGYCDSASKAKELFETSGKYKSFLEELKSKTMDNVASPYTPYGITEHDGHSITAITVYTNTQTYSDPIFNNIKWKCTGTPNATVGDAQDLIRAGKVTIKYGKTTDEIDFPWTVDITLEKEVVDENGEKIDDNQEFYFEIATQLDEVDGKENPYTAYQEILRAGESKTIKISSDVAATDYYIIETDEHQLSYYDWVAAGKPENSLWNRYQPKNGVDQNHLGAYKKNSDKFYHVTNTKQPHEVPVRVYKKVPHGTASDDDEFIFNVRIYKNDETNSVYWKHFGVTTTGKNTGDSVKVEISQEGNYDVISATVPAFKWYGDDTYRVEIEEVDNDGATYANYLTDLEEGKDINIKSIWNKFKQSSTTGTTGTLVDGETYDAIIENQPNEVSVDLSLLKTNSNLDNHDDVLLLAGIDEWHQTEDGQWSVRLVNDQTINIKTNGDPKEYKYELDNPEKDSYYFLRITEIQSDDYIWKEFDVDNGNYDAVVLSTDSGWLLEAIKEENKDKWIIYRDPNTQKIISATKMINKEYGSKNKFTVTIDNEDTVKNAFTAIRINKKVLNYNNVITDRKFYFKVGTNKNGNFTDYTRKFFSRDHGESDYNAEYDYIEVDFDENLHGYVKDSYVIEWPFSTNSEILTLKEVDQYGVEYPGENKLDTLVGDDGEQGHSIWFDYKPIDADANLTILLNKQDYATPDAVYAALDNGDLELKAENAIRYKGKIQIEKYLETPATEDNIFYFSVDSINNTFENIDSTKTPYDYFNANDVVVLKNQNHSKAVKIVVKKGDNYASVESNEITWTSNMENPKMRIMEVDQYNQAYPGSAINVEHADSLWHKYYPVRLEAEDTSIYPDEAIEINEEKHSVGNSAGNYTCQILPDVNKPDECKLTIAFANKPNAATGSIWLTKVVINPETGLQEKPQDDEVFGYKLEFTSNTGRQIPTIDRVELSVENNWNYFKEFDFELEENEVITVRATEIDENNESYAPGKEYEDGTLWTKFRPTYNHEKNGGYGVVIAKVVENSSEHVWATLTGLNEKVPTPVEHKLKIQKFVGGKTITNDDKFYFKVMDNNNSKDVTKDLFGTNYVVLDKDNQSKESKIIITKDTETYTYTIIEVDDKGMSWQEYLYKKASNEAQGINETISEFWETKYVPESPNPVWQVTISKDSPETVVVKAYNDEIVPPDHVGLAISKSIVDLEDNSLTTLKQDSPEFKFKVYLKNYTNRFVIVHTPGEYIGYWTPTAIEELDKKSAEYKNGYRGVIETSIKVNAGNVSSFVEIYGIEIKSGSKLEYKVVEEADASSYKFANVEAPEGMVSAKNGVYEGTLNADEYETFETIGFYNAFRKVKLNLEKLVYDENGELVPIEPGERFVFEVVYNDDETTKQEVVIDYDNQTWKDEIELGIDDELKYTITETAAYVDGNNENVLGTVFVPVNDKAEMTGTVGKDVNGSIDLQGENALVPYTLLPIEKTFSEESDPMLDGSEKFYFKVKSEDGKQDYTELFGGRFAKDSETEDNNYVIEVSADENGRYRWLSNPTPWVGLNNEIEKSSIKDWLTKDHKVKVVEVDQWGDEYPGDDKLNELNENSVWFKFKPVKITPEVYTLPIYASENKADIEFKNILVEMQNSRYLSDDLAVEAENAQKLTGHITVGKTVVGTTDENDKFYFKITKLNGSEENYEWLKDDLVKEYFKDATTVTSKGDNTTKLLVLKANEEVTSSDIEWYSNEHRPQFVLSEVDQYGQMWTGDENNITHKDSTWFKYQPVDKKWASTVTAQLIAGANYEFGYEFDELFENKLEDRHLNISKVVENGEFDGPYYFKVNEITTGNGQSFSKDVTSELFNVNEKGYLEITTEDSVRSNNIFGTHKYVITEYDENGKSYTDYLNGKSSDFWATRYVPSNLDSVTPGSWTVTVNKENPEVNFIAKNLKWVTGLEVHKDAEEDETFKATLKIFKNKYTKAIYVKDAKTNKVSEPLDSKTYEITFSKNNPFVLEDCITWVGEAPIWCVNEITDNTGWKLEGYKVNNAQGYSADNGGILTADPSENENIVYVKNTKLDNVSLQIIKERRNTTNNRGIIDPNKDYTYDVEIYLKNYESNTYTLVQGMGDDAVATTAEISAIPETAKYGNGYTGYIKTTVTVKAGKLIGTTYINNIVVEDGAELGYKVVEVDKDGYSYDDRAKSTDTLWNKTKPTIENKEGTVSADKAKTGISKVVTIQNMYKIIEVVLDKHVDNGPIQEGEKFYYDATFTSSNGTVNESYTHDNKNQITLEYDIKHEKDRWVKEFVLDLDETLSYDIVETDGNGLSYTTWVQNGQPETDTWDIFKPIDDGKINGVIDNDEDFTRSLNGYNEFIPYTFLPIEKIISEESDPIISENTKFYFKVKSINGDKDYTALFSNIDAKKAENGKVIEVSMNARKDFRAITNVTKWEEKSNAIIIVEVDQYGDTKAIEADSTWNEFKCLKNEVAYELPEFDSKVDAEKAHDATAKYLAKENLTVEERAEIIDIDDFAEIENAQKLKGHIEITKHVEGTADENDRFYFTITKLNGSEENYEWFNEKVIETYFSGYETKEVEGKTLLVLKAEETAKSSDIEWYSNEHHPQFVLSEVDQYGQMWTGDIENIKHEDSIWYKYQPVLSKYATTVTAQLIAGPNYEFKYEYGKTFNNQKVAPKNLTLVKKVEDGNFDGPYYFKVTENGNEVTDLFPVNDAGYIEINSENGITSTDVYGTHKYVITEYAKEGNEYVSYADYEQGKASEFWSTRYKAANNGVWEVELNTSTKFELKNTRMHSAGFSILKDVVNEAENEVGTHKDVEFKVVYKIVPSSKTESISLRNADGKYVASNKGETQTITISEATPYEEHKYEAGKDNYIVWTGEAPKLVVEELGKTDWKLVGYKKLSDGENSEFKVDNTFTLEDNTDTAIVVGNEYTANPDEVSIQIEKTVVDLNGVKTKLNVDSPVFYFDIYLDNVKNFGNKNYTLESAEGKPYAIDNESGMTYKYYVRVPVIVKAGTSSTEVTVDGFEIPSGSTVNYKVVEADKNGYSYDDRNKSNDDLWNKTKPTIFSDGKSGNIKGIWTGKLDKSTPVSDKAKIAAYNIIRQVQIVFEKYVVDKNGNRVGIVDGEVFHFNIEYTNHTEENKSKDITYTNKKIIETLTLNLDETEHVKITEVDGRGDTYQNRKDGSDIWEKFAPEDGIGIFEADIAENVDGSIELKGTNVEEENTLYDRISIGKSAVNEAKTNKDEQFVNNEFYFKVENSENVNVVDKLFDNYKQLDKADNMNVVVLHPGENVASKVISWKEGTEAPTYSVYEVDQYGQTYAYFQNPENTVKGKRENGNNEELSTWEKFSANNPNGLTKQLVGKYNEALLTDRENWTEYHYTNTILPKFWSLEIRKDQDGGPVAEGEHFYVEIAKEKTDNILGLDELKVLFPDATTEETETEGEKDIVKLGSGKYGVHLYKDHDIVKTAEVLDERDTYFVIEVDKAGNTIEKADKEDKNAIFKRFTIENSKDGIFKVNSKENAIVINNIGEDKATVTVRKELEPGQSTDEVFNFTVLVKNEEGKFVDSGYTFDLKANETSDEIEFAWRKDQSNPVIQIVENGKTPSAIYVDGEKYEPDAVPALTLTADHKYSFKFENDVEKTGNIVITKKFTDDIPVNPNGMPKYTFNYEYYVVDENGKEVTHSKTQEITVEAGKSQTTSNVKWNENQKAYFKVWEVGQTPKKITVDGQEADVTKPVEGEIIEAKERSVNVEFTNGDWDNGGVKAIKTIVAQKAGGLSAGIQSLPDDYAMNFTLTIKPGKDSMFVYNEKTYSDSNSDVLTMNKSISKSDLITYSNGNDQSVSITIFDIAKDAIKWPKGFAEPEYSVVETPDNNFVVTEGTLNNNGSLKNNNVIITEITNLREEVHWDLVITEMSGMVWEDVDVANKVGESAAGGHDGKYTEADKLIQDGVYVKLARVYYKDGVEKDRMYNGERMRIAKDDGNGGLVADSEYLTFMSNKETIENNGQTYIAPKAFVEVKDGKYSFGNVLVPAFTQREVDNGFDTNQGWRVRYDVEFYYDGIKYEPTKLVVGNLDEEQLANTPEATRVKAYIANPNDPQFIGDANNNYYGGNSFATEDETSRVDFNKNHFKVENVSPMDEKGHSVGKIGSATIDYEMVNQLDGNGRTIVQSKGTIDLNTNGNDMDDNGMTVKATTSKSGIDYMLSTENYLYIDLSAADQVTSLSIEQPNIQTNSTTTVNGKVYKQIYEYANHINLGLVNRSQAATTLDKTIDTATLIINQKVYTYEFNPEEFKFTLNKLSSNDREEITNYLTQVVNNDNKKLLDENGEETDGNVNVYQSDYYYRAINMYKDTDVYTALDRFYKAMHIQNTDNAELATQDLSNIVNSLNLQVYLTYRITLTNCSSTYDIEVYDIDDYSESSLQYIDVKSSGYIADSVGGKANLGSGLYAYIGNKEDEHGAPVLTNVLPERFAKDTFTSDEYSNNTKRGITVTIDDKDVKFNKNTIIPKETIELNPGDSKTFYTTYKVTSEITTNGTNILLGEKRNIAEIKSFTAYEHDKYYEDEEGTHKLPAAVIDIASAPGNYNLSNNTYKLTEADTDVAITDLGMYTTEPIRTIKGTAWLDNNHDGYYKAEDDSLLSGIHAELVEVMDVPVYEEDGEELILLGVDDKAMYTEYDFYLKDNSVTTSSNGTYSFDKTTLDGIEHNGLLPGNYEVRFFYGDNADVRIEGSDKLPMINGMDYKTTAYRVGDTSKFSDDSKYINNEWYTDSAENDNEARDNEARRLLLTKENQNLNNSNTSIFDVADYASAEDYATAKLRGLDEEVYKKLTTLERNSLMEQYKVDYESYKAKLFKGINLPERNGSVAYSGVLEGNRDGDYTMFADTAKIVLEQNAENKENIDLGLEERKEAKVILDKQIKEISFISAGNDGKEIFHVKYNIYYGTTEDFKDGAHLIYTDGNNNIYVAMELDTTSVIGDDILLKADDIFEVDENGIPKVTQGFRYINVDSLTLQGLQVKVQYQITAINIGETDYMGEGLAAIMDEEAEQTRENKFDSAILTIATPDYTINSSEDRLLMNVNDSTFKGKAKTYGYYLGHAYYEGKDKENSDIPVTVKVTKVVDYIDNDINFAPDSVDTENAQRWNLSGNTEALSMYIDKNVFSSNKIYNELELPFNDGHIAITNQTDNAFIKDIESFNKGDKEIPDSAQTMTYITLSDTKAGTDMGDYGVDNYAEILEVFNPIATRDRTSVYGNYDPRLGAPGTIEGDETSTEIITLSPPTGNEDNARTMAIAIGTIVVIAVLAGAGTGLGLKISTKKSKKDEE